MCEFVCTDAGQSCVNQDDVRARRAQTHERLHAARDADHGQAGLFERRLADGALRVRHQQDAPLIAARLLLLSTCVRGGSHLCGHLSCLPERVYYGTKR